ncbi:MAG: putative baseplate assembly protein [Ilumatobacteraceae bacterium]
MSLPVPNLDDRGFQDFVDDAKRLIPQKLPAWTNHNVSDPGVALIELFAWMSEAVIFRLNQTPDKLYTQFLNLLGVRPFPARAATADLTFWLSAPTDNVVTVPAGTTVSAIDVDDGRRHVVEFATTADLSIAQPTLTAALTGHGESGLHDVFDDLRFDRERVEVFSSKPILPGDCFYLGFAGSLAGHVLQLDVTAEALGVGIRPEDAPVKWEVWTGKAWAECTRVSDTTGGLNRDGVIVLLVPGEHEPTTLEQIRAWWLRIRYVKPAPGQEPYHESPQVHGLRVMAVGGTVLAEHSVTVAGEILGRSTGRPGQEMRLRNEQVLPRRAGETVRVSGPDQAGRVVAHDWTEVSDFSMSGPHDRHFVWDDADGVIVFGPSVHYPNGDMVQHGAVPPMDALVEVTSYRHGGGQVGTIPPGAIRILSQAIPYVDRVANLAPSSGGVDAETHDNVKTRGPMTVRTGQRAVTTGDYERLTLEHRHVARARCLRPTTPNDPVRVLVVPTVDKPAVELGLDDFVLTDSLYHDIGQRLDECRVLGSRIEVTTPYYVGVSVAVLVRATPGLPQKPLGDLVVDTISRFLSPLTGGPDGQGWPWEVPLNTAMLHGLISDIPGIVSVDELVMFAVNLRDGKRLGEPLQALPLDDRSLYLGFSHQAVVK